MGFSSAFEGVKYATSWKMRCRFLHQKSPSDSWLPLQTAVTSTHNISLVPAVNIRSRSEVREADCHQHSSFEFSRKHCVPVSFSSTNPVIQPSGDISITSGLQSRFIDTPQTLQKKVFAPPWNVPKFHPAIIMLVLDLLRSFKAARSVRKCRSPYLI